MRHDIELFADTILLTCMIMAGSLLIQIDPLLASLWAVVTFIMSWQHSH
jgi:hypothetical protein